MNRETKTRTVTNANAATTKTIVDRDVAVGVDTVDAVEVVEVSVGVAEDAVVEKEQENFLHEVIMLILVTSVEDVVTLLENVKQIM